jgi:hypothetical protein
MKTKLVTALFALIVLTAHSYCQLSFGISPGISLNSAYFGYKINNKIVPFIGFQYLNANFKYEESGVEYDWSTNQMVSYSDKSDFSGSLYIPNIGVKYFVKQRNKLQAYFSLCLSKPMLSGKLKTDGVDDDEFKDDIKHIKMWGGELGFGVEYFFDDNFSIGGEFGLRYIHLKYDHTTQNAVFDPNLGAYVNKDIKDDYKFNMSPTYSKISLNYYF